MRSLNSAEKLGREIGRSVPDVWISDNALMREVQRVVSPRIALLRSDEDRHRDAVGSVLGIMILAAACATIVAALRAVPADLIAGVEFLSGISDALAALPLPLLIAASLLFVAIAVICGALYARARNDAEVQYKRTVESLYRAAYSGAVAALSRRRGTVGTPLDVRSGSRVWPRPQPIQRRISPVEAEELVAAWMRHLGENSAEVTRHSGDGGIDVVGARNIAQVKHHASRIGVAAIREIAGVAANDYKGRRPLFFTSTGYAAGAVDFAEQAGVALFLYDSAAGQLAAVNSRAISAMRGGL